MSIPRPPVIETDLIIIGSGVAGLTLASGLAETNLDFWLLGSPFESQLAKAGILENTPLPEGTVGLKFIEVEMERVKSKGINHRSSNCTGIEQMATGFKVETKFQDFITQSIIIATGNKQKSLGFEGEEEWFRKGISDCTVCDYPLYRDRPVAVVGNHDYTIRAAKLMAKHTSPVALLWYRSDGAPELEGIEVYNNVTNLVARGDDTLTGVSFEHATGSTDLEISGLFVEGQPVPETGFLSPLVLDLHDGFISVSDQFQTSVPKVWAVGDVTGRTSNYIDAKQDAERLVEIIKSELQ